MHAELRHVATDGRDAAGVVECPRAPAAVQPACAQVGPGGASSQRKDEGALAPQHASSSTRRGEVGLEDLRRRLRRERIVRRLAPESYATPGADASGAPASLIGRRARYPGAGLEPTHPGRRIEEADDVRAPRPRRCAPVDCQAGFGERFVATTILRRLRVRRARHPVPRHRVRRRAAGTAACRAGAAPRVRRPRAGSRPRRAGTVRRPDGSRARRGMAETIGPLIRAPVRSPAAATDVHREHAAGRAHDRGAVQQPRDRVAAERRRHHEQPGATRAGDAASRAQREPEVRLLVALVEFVEHDERDVLERAGSCCRRRVRMLGDDLDPGRGPDPARVACGSPPWRPPVRRAATPSARRPRAAIRRGSSISIRPSPRRGASSSASGTTVFCWRRPAPRARPSGALRAAVRGSAGRASRIGSGEVAGGRV